MSFSWSDIVNVKEIISCSEVKTFVKNEHCFVRHGFLKLLNLKKSFLKFSTVLIIKWSYLWRAACCCHALCALCDCSSFGLCVQSMVGFHIYREPLVVLSPEQHT